VAATIRIAILANAAKARAELDSVTQRSSKLKDAFKAGAAAAGVAAGAFAVSAVKQAADLNETLNKSSVIFGKNAKAMETWAGDAARTVGLSKQAALETAAGFGDMFSQIGFGQDQSAKLSQSTVQLAADLGSFNNLGTDEVLDKISGAYRGEYDALQALIPNISAARVEQEALALSHKKTGKELTAQDKALAINNILSKDGARAVGDFAKTSSGAANQQKILRAEFDNLSAGVGQRLLPVLNTGLVVLGKLITLAGNPAFQVAAVAVGVLAGAVYAVNAAAKIYTATQAALNIVMSLNPIGLVVLAVVALVAAIVIAYKKSETFRRIVDAVGAALLSAGKKAVEFVTKAIAYIKTLPDRIKAEFNRVKTLLTGLGGDLVAGFKKGISDKWGAFTGWIEAQVNKIPLAVRKVLGIASPSKVMAALGQQTWAGYAQGSEKAARAARIQFQAQSRRLADAAAKSSSPAMRKAGRVATAVYHRALALGLSPQVIARAAQVSARIYAQAEAQEYARRGKAARRGNGAVQSALLGTSRRTLRSRADAIAQKAIDAAKEKTKAWRQRIVELKKARDEYASTIASNLRGGGITSLVSLDGVSKASGVDAVVRAYRDRLQAVKDFRAGIDQLRKKGFGNGLLQQIVDGGFDAGGALVASLRTASPAVLAQIRSLNAALERESASFGTAFSGSVFNDRIAAKQPPTVIEVRSGGSKLDDLMVEVLRKSIRAKGGNVQAVLGAR
jgi:hypothetical protein